VSEEPVPLVEILLVDDSDADNFLHQRVIKKLGCTNHVETCENGREALDYLESTKGSEPSRPSLIFLDLNMPAVDGWEFLARYEEADGRQPPIIVMLTTSHNPDDRTRAEAHPSVSDFLIKPLTKDSLREVLHKFFPSHGWQ